MSDNNSNKSKEIKEDEENNKEEKKQEEIKEEEKKEEEIKEEEKKEEEIKDEKKKDEENIPEEVRQSKNGPMRASRRPLQEKKIPKFEDKLSQLLYEIKNYSLLVNKIDTYANAIPLGSFCFSISFILYGFYEAKINKEIKLFQEFSNISKVEHFLLIYIYYMVSILLVFSIFIIMILLIILQ